MYTSAQAKLRLSTVGQDNFVLFDHIPGWLVNKVFFKRSKEARNRVSHIMLKQFGFNAFSMSQKNHV